MSGTLRKLGFVAVRCPCPCSSVRFVQMNGDLQIFQKTKLGTLWKNFMERWFSYNNPETTPE